MGGRLKVALSQEVRVVAPSTWMVFRLPPWVSWCMVVGNQWQLLAQEGANCKGSVESDAVL